MSNLKKKSYIAAQTYVLSVSYISWLIFTMYGQRKGLFAFINIGPFVFTLYSTRILSEFLTVLVAIFHVLNI